jgi:hypothetical protein
MFDTFELSRFFGRKVALYRFTRGSIVWRFTSADRDRVVGGQTYLSARGISHTEIRESVSSTQKNQVTVTLPYRLDVTADDLPVTQSLGDNWMPYPPSQRIFVDILTQHVDDPDAETRVEWMGRVVGPSFTDTELKLTCDPSYRTGKIAGTGRRWLRGCGVPLYSQGIGMCNLDKATQALPATLSAVSGLQLTAAAFATAPLNLAGGFLEWTRSDGLLEERTIHTGDAIVIDYGALDLAAALAVTAYPGCEHNLTACGVRGNSINYPGYKDLPTEDPMPRSQAW